MGIIITLLSSLTNEMAEFWCKALSIKPGKTVTDSNGRICYIDLYHRNEVVMRIVQSSCNTTNVILSKAVWDVKKEYSKLSKKNLPCEWFPQKNNLFSIKDPQGNELVVYKHPNAPKEE